MKSLKYRNGFKYIMAIAALFTMVSCGDWLTVNPKSEIPAEQFFETEIGFQDALIGAYIQMKDSKAYGESLTMSHIEHLVSFHDLTSSEETNKIVTGLNSHQYHDSSIEEQISKIYSQLYKVISSVNLILSYIDDNRKVLSTVEMYNMIKGECLTIRAMCHLDILRLFGPVPSQAGSAKIIPYVTTLGVEIIPYSSFKEYSTLMLKDLSEAEILLAEDPIKLINSKHDNIFLQNRQFRFNYYGVKALQARANLYFGNDKNAYDAAKTVIEAKDNFKLGTLADYSTTDQTLSVEHIVALYDFKMPKRYDALFAGFLKKGSSNDLVKKSIYGNTGTDIREPGVGTLWSLKVGGNGINYLFNNKYEPKAKEKNRIPLLRLSEMYLIAAEAAPLNEAQGYWSAYRLSRGIHVTTLDENNRKFSVMEEYRKEFYIEGQMFFTHKRMNSQKSDILWFPSGASVNYVLPLPKTEIY